MNPDIIIDLGRDAAQTMILISAPVLLIALGVGLVIGVLQAATQVQEMTLSFIPKLFAIVVTLALLGRWMMAVLVDYTHRLVTSIPGFIG
ncbi:MAG: flagellar biosynthesis protein FliQ [Xanthomonadales bacterium]|nr:flagellar biosynthesis protein FliQ [Xanthomonadales bacterium]